MGVNCLVVFPTHLNPNNFLFISLQISRLFMFTPALSSSRLKFVVTYLFTLLGMEISHWQSFRVIHTIYNPGQRLCTFAQIWSFCPSTPPHSQHNVDVDSSKEDPLFQHFFWAGGGFDKLNHDFSLQNNA